VALEADAGAEATTRTWLSWLVGARLLLAGLSLGLAVIVDRLDSGQGNPAILGVYWTVVVAFTATIASALMAPRTRNPDRFATVQVAIDVGIVTALVYFSGGGDSVFTFLYALVVLYGALVLDRTGVGLSAGLAALGYGFVLFGSEMGLLPVSTGDGREHSLMVLGAYWGFYAGALLVLGMLANTLSAELRRTGAALDRRTHDLRRLRDLHLRTVESIGSGLLTTNDEGRVTSFNPEAERISGVSAAVAEGQLLEDVIPGATRVVQELNAGGVSDNPAMRNRIAFRNQNEEDLFLGLGASSLRDEEGARLGHVVIFQDVTQVVSMEHDLRQSERLAAVGEMAARMAHEIRNPLAAISGSVQVLQSSGASKEGDPDADPERDRLMGIVVREVDRLNDLIGDFLLYSRPAPLRTEPVCLANLVEEVAKMNEGTSMEGIEIELDLDSSVEICADRSQLSAVVWNLWINAIQAMPDSGRLSVRVSRVPGELAQDGTHMGRNATSTVLPEASAPGSRALLEVEDSGSGIPPEAREMIFDPFYTTKPDGTGLGLATVQRIIEQHGGSIQMSTEVGVGTCFRVQLRCAGADG
jgi:two-component system, NtrC family, sensor histidine kinase PilS